MTDRDDCEVRLPVKRVAGQMKVRKCLRCDLEFRSRGAHNRICSLCSASNANKLDLEESNFEWSMMKHRPSQP